MRIFLAILIPLLFITACDTTVQQGDTNITIVVDDEGRIDSVQVDDDWFSYEDFDGDGDGFGSDGDGLSDDFSFDSYSHLGAYVASWELTEVIAADLGVSNIEVNSPRRLEVYQVQSTEIGLMATLNPADLSDTSCVARFDFAPVNSSSPEGTQSASLPWMGAPCFQSLYNPSLDVEMSITGDSLLRISSNEFVRMGELASLMVGSDQGLPTNVIALEFKKTDAFCSLFDC